MGNAPAVTLLGVTVGLQYALLGVGLVLVFKANRFVSFAQGQIGVLGSLVLAKLVLDAGVAYWVALPVAVAAAATTGALVELTVVRRLAGTSPLVLLLATIGVGQILFVATVAGPLTVDPAILVDEGFPVPFDASWSVGPITLVSSQLLTLVLAPLIAVGLAAFLARSETGRAIRAAASNPDAARLAGISVRRTSLLAWVVAGVLAGLTAILLAPTQPSLDTSILGPGLLLRALAAALAGGLVSLPATFAAGIGIGVIEQTAFWHVPRGGTSDLAVLAVVLVTLVVRRHALAAVAGEGSLADLARPRRRRAPGPADTGPTAGTSPGGRPAGRAGWAALAGAAVVLPLVPGFDTQEQAVLLGLMGCYALVALGLTLLTGWAGLVSLGHFALLGLGAYVAARTGDAGWALPAAMLTAGAVAAIAAVAVGLPAVRSRGLVLAVATLAVAMAAPSWLFRQSWLSEGATGNAAYRDVRLPGIGAVDTPQARYYLVLAVVGSAVLGLGALRRSAPGRALVAVRENERAASAHGLPPVRVRVSALAVSGFLAGVAGALWAAVQGNFSFQAFAPTLSVAMLAAVVVGGAGRLHGALLGTIAVWAWPYLVPDANTLVVRTVSSGALLLGILLIAPAGLAGALDDLRARIPTSRARPDPASGPGRATVAPVTVRSTVDGGGRPGAAGPPPAPAVDALDVRSLAISFGGLVALEDVDLRVGAGEVVGLIGGNGAGKSTLMSCVSGHLVPQHGHVRLFGTDVTGWSPVRRSRLGMARSFQDARLYPDLTVLESTMVALDGAEPSGTLSALVGAPWVGAAEQAKRATALAALERVGLADHAGAPVGQLSTGMRRLCELALVVAARPALVLLDEPTAGVAQREVEALTDVLVELRAEHGFAVLIVEHDLPLLLSICDRLYALEAGSVLCEGPPDEVRSDPRVIASYLGTDPDAVARSGRRAGTGTPTTAPARPAGRRRPIEAGPA